MQEGYINFISLFIKIENVVIANGDERWTETDMIAQTLRIESNAKGQKNKKRVIGLMSGTSADGIDVAAVEIEGHGSATRVQLIAFDTVPFPPGVQDSILALCQPDTGRVDKICEMNFRLGHLFADAVKHLLDTHGIPARDIALIGSHGQTIHHLPKAPYPSTLQIGEPAVIAHQTGIPTIADFRVADMAAGGQGAPLVAYPDYLLYRDEHETRGLLNIGGIANITVLPANCTLDAVAASDTGPGNMAIDAVVSEITDGAERFDTAGQRAARGTPYLPLVEKWLTHAFFAQAPPKTTGREMFGITFAQACLAQCRAQGLDDDACVATVTELTVQSIAQYVKQFVSVGEPSRSRCPSVGETPQPQPPSVGEPSQSRHPSVGETSQSQLPVGEPSQSRCKIDRLYISGGGTQNQTLMRRLAQIFPDSTVLPVENSDAKEAIAFAILANEALHGQAGNVPSATGASVRKVLGKFVYP